MDLPMPGFSPAAWAWWLGGAMAGLWLVPLGRIIPEKVLRLASAPPDEWQGPGGGLGRPVPPLRLVWVPLLSALLWALSGSGAAPGAIASAALSSALLLLAIIDWDTTMLPDWVVLPLGLAGLLASHLGLTGQGVVSAAVSAVLVLALLGGSSALFRLVRGTAGVGGGDLKLLAALGAWWGIGGVLHVLLWASLGTVVWYFVWRRFMGLREEAEWPFGPAIAIAALVWAFAG
ncbi:A24 family peptidase [Chlorobium sp. N1]|uniref:prepilin peptidase n=1 Tax=Chlorobium sp. N1 TaxID=2491138 RepID=UPI001039C096|nr:A24 family peptidase [Chlorobium sp. N1]TCD47237.1 prepilin peptidase [Chlorobium sp. N1]